MFILCYKYLFYTSLFSLKQSYVKSNGCDVCNSLSLGACICKKNNKSISTLQPSQTVCPSHTSIETTPLEDLPGITKFVF